uniref:replication protein n=1 Tax=uncultured Ruminococcus sp. TaxID=165186 RepID=UPI0026101918
MASPQKENGYTAIANELLEHIYSARLTCLELKTILVILRYTYGFNGRKETELSYSFIAKAISIQRRNAIRNISSLVAKNMIFITGNRGEHDGNIIRFNKNYDSWILPSVASDTSVMYDTTPSVVYDTTPSVTSDTQQNKNITLIRRLEILPLFKTTEIW